jgi:hypothetical protein
MSALQNSSIDLDIFYKNPNVPKISLGDKVKVVIFLELPKETAEGEKKRKGTYPSF